jgi:YfiR/HmsC-like
MPPAPPRRRLLQALAAGWLLPSAGWAQNSAEARVKARLTANLARFTTWPASSFGSAADPIVICVAHRNAALGAAFEELAGLALGARTLRIVHNPATLASCHLLYLDADFERQQPGWLAQVGAKPILTVGDGNDFVQRGMIELVNVNDAMRFDVHLGRMRRTQMDLSSQALRLARQVQE